MWYLTTSSKEPDTFFWPPQAPDIHDALTHIPNAHIRININLKQQQKNLLNTGEKLRGSDFVYHVQNLNLIPNITQV